MDELRFRSQQSPRNDASLLGLVSPPRNGTRIAQPSQTQDARGGLMRRFTTDSGRVPTIASISSQRGTQESSEYGPSVCYCPSRTIVIVPHNSGFPVFYQYATIASQLHSLTFFRPITRSSL